MQNNNWKIKIFEQNISLSYLKLIIIVIIKSRNKTIIGQMLL